MQELKTAFIALVMGLCGRCCQRDEKSAPKATPGGLEGVPWKIWACGAEGSGAMWHRVEGKNPQRV